MDYKAYSLQQLEEWIYDSLNTESTPQEIFDVIVSCAKSNVEYHKEHLDRNLEFLKLIGVSNINTNTSKKDWDDFWDAL